MQREQSNRTPTTTSRAKLVASAAICAALYATVNALTAFIRTPWGVGEFRPGVVVPGFFAVTVGPVPAALGAAVGSFIGDMVSLVPTGGSTPLLAILAGAPANFIGFLILGWVYQKLKNWKGFVAGTTAGLFFGNLWAATAVVLLVPSLSLGLIPGFLFYWFGTMFPFVVILVPPLVRVMRPYASSLSPNRDYPEIVEPNRKVLWTWSIVVAVLVLAAMAAAFFSSAPFIATHGGGEFWEGIFVISAISVLAVGAFLPRKRFAESATAKQIQTN
jgi:hypothetical protein